MFREAGGEGGAWKVGGWGRHGWLGMGRACLIQIPSSNREGNLKRKLEGGNLGTEISNDSWTTAVLEMKIRERKIRKQENQDTWK
jgi:hypothetical protein